MNIQERYSATLIPVNATVVISSSLLGGFLCVTSGSIAFTSETLGVIFPALPVTAGAFTKLPFSVGQTGGTLIASGGASGVLAT
jgi:hypothetical protein